MERKLSDNAREIVDAGMRAAALRDFSESDRAVVNAVGRICGKLDGFGEVTAIDALIEIAQQLVRAKAAGRV